MSGSSETFSLHIKQSDGKKHTVTAAADQTVLQLKEEVAKVSEVPVDRQRLIFAGKVLKDEDTLTSYNLKNDLTIHLVRSNPAAKAAAASATTATPTPTPTQNTVTPAANNANPMINPFAAMGGGADSGMFGAMGQNPSNLQSTLMSDPNYMNMVSSLMSNPEVVREMVQNNPQLQSMGMSPEQISSMVSMINTPQMREMMANPQMREMMASMGGGMGGMGGGMGGANPFAAMGGAGGNGFGAGATPGEGAPAGMPNMAALMSQFGGAPTGGAAQPAANLPPPEERFQVQLQQLNDMGFFDAQKNIRALLATGGNVHAAIEYLFSNTN